MEAEWRFPFEKGAAPVANSAEGDACAYATWAIIHLNAADLLPGLGGVRNFPDAVADIRKNNA